MIDMVILLREIGSVETYLLETVVHTDHCVHTRFLTQ